MTKKKWIIGSTIAAAAIASIFFFSTYSLGTTRYVQHGASGGCSNGSTNYIPASNTCSGGAGSGATVYSSIDNALAANTTVAGDTLFIRAGTYAERIDGNTRTVPSGTSFANAPVISAYTGETVALQKLNLAKPTIKYVIFQNLILNNNSGLNDDEIVSIGSGANHIRLVGCEITGSHRQGVHMGAAGDDANEFINCNVHHNGSTQNLDHGFYIASSGNIIDGCLIHDNYAFGMQIYNPSARANGNVFKNNVVYNNTRGPSGNGDGTGSGILISSGDDNAVYNNIVYGQQLYGIDVYAGGSGNPQRTLIYNNTIYNNANGGMRIESGAGTGAIVKNNIVFNSNGGITNSGGATVGTNLCNTVASGCTIAYNAGQPLFVSLATTPDLHLATNSQAIDKGVVIALFSNDIDNNSRPQGAAWDLGADEFATGGSDSMTVTSNTGGGNWPVGSPQTITWGCVGCTGPIDIDLSRNGGSTYTEVIANDYPLASGSSYNWTVTAPTNASCMIRVRDNDTSPSGTSTAFAITASAPGTITVTEPKSGDVFMSGQNGPVRWSSTNISGTIKIEISRDGGTTWTAALDINGNPITGLGYADGDEAIQYLAPTSSNCKVRVVSNDGSNTTGTSSGTFRIGGTRAGFLLLP